MAARGKKKKGEQPKEVAFEYLKSNLFRVISARGAFGGLSPTGHEIHMALFSERRAIPRKTIYEVGPDGKLLKEIMEKREVRSGFVRELEIDVALDLQTAILIQEWLQDKIQQLAKAQGVEIQVSDSPPPKKNGAARKRNHA